MKINSIWSFYKVLFKNPRAMGSAFPSSRYLARKIASYIPEDIHEYVVELGAGTGVITKALLRKGIPHHRIIIVESAPALAKSLQKRFPQIPIIQGNAMDLVNLLGEKKHNVRVIVSSIPLLSLLPEEKNRVIEQIEKTLKPGSYYIQYTYGTKQSAFEKKHHFQKIASTWVWLNVPPARVDVFKVIS